MSKRMKTWAYAAALFSGALFGGGGCFGGFGGGNWQWIWAILQEDLFG